MDNQRNVILAAVLCILLIFGWDAAMRYIYPQPAEPVAAEQADAAPQASTSSAKHTREGGLSDPTLIAEEKRDLKSALAAPQRVSIDAPELAGSINLVGARVDDLTLRTHRQTVKKDSGPVRIFSPQGTPAEHFAQFGWVGEGVKLPDPRTLWTANGAKLTQDSPVTLSWDNGEGQRFLIKLSVDEKYMLTAEQTIANTGTGSVVVEPFALINRTSKTASQDTWNVHSGPIADVNGAVDFDLDYDTLAEDGTSPIDGSTEWIGFTDIYWLSALIPQEGQRLNAAFRAQGNELYRADTIYAPVTVAAGKQVSRTTRLFAGAKESNVLRDYEAQGIVNFGKSIDWGWFEIIAWPIWWLLTKLFGLVGNFGLAIILLTVIIRGLMFPIAQKQFASMAAMKAIQPKMKAIQERYSDDKQKQQQEIMALYKKEGVNPLAGCLPILIQIPIFFALYKTLLLSIEMRHQPFYLWIRDLSAPDPAKILNLFGLLPFDPPSFLGIGILAVLLGVTMWLTFRLNPTAMDPVQQQIFSIMPWMLMFVMAPFAAGLLLYWVTSNILTLAQQTYLYSQHPQLKAASEKQKTDIAAVKARDEKRKG